MTSSAISVRNLPVDPGPAGWNAILPPQPPARPLDHDRSADWLIIGAGLAGLAAARRLTRTRPGDRIVVLDAVRIAAGPAGRNSGFMIDLPHKLTSETYAGSLDADRAQIRANRLAIDFALAAAADYRMPAEAIVRRGKINAAATDHGVAHNAGFRRHLDALGEESRLLTAADMQALTGTGYYRDGLFTPHAAMIQPALFVRHMARGLATDGVAIHENSPVLALQRQPSGGWHARTPDGSVTTGAVILAVNGHAESFGLFRRRLMHVFTFAAMTRALTPDEVRRLGGEAEWGLTPADPAGTTVRRVSGTGGDRIVVRNQFVYEPRMRIGENRLRRIARGLHSAFRHRFPMLPDMEMEYQWGGRLCLSRNDAPAFGEVEPGLYAACCQNGLGTARGTFSGIAAADLACGNETEFSQHQMAQPHPTRLPPVPFATFGANLYLKWLERSAGREK